MKKILLLILVACLILTACSVKCVEDMRKDPFTGFFYITISDIGERRVKPDNYALCGIDDAIRITGFAYGKGYYLVKCW